MFSLCSFYGESFFIYYFFGEVSVLVRSVWHKHPARYHSVHWYEQSLSKLKTGWMYWVKSCWTCFVGIDTAVQYVHLFHDIKKPLFSPLLALGMNYCSLWSAALLIENKRVFWLSCSQLGCISIIPATEMFMLSANCELLLLGTARESVFPVLEKSVHLELEKIC